MSVKFYVVNELTMEHNPTDEVLRVTYMLLSV